MPKICEVYQHRFCRYQQPYRRMPNVPQRYTSLRVVGQIVRFVGALVLLFSPFFFSEAQAQEINVTELKLNDSLVCGMTVRALTDDLGRPSEVDDTLVDIAGPEMVFESQGLAFLLGPGKATPESTVQAATINLVPRPDGSDVKSEYSGTFVDSINADWKFEATATYYQSQGFDVELKPSEKRSRAAQESDTPHDDDADFPSMVRLLIKDHWVNLLHSRSTGFINRIVFACNQRGE
jgi:hypothetical protein